MRRSDCMRNQDTLLVPGDTGRSRCSAHTQVPSFSAAYRWHTVRHYTRASRELVDVKPRRQIICNTRCERAIKLVRLKLNSNSQYFAIFNQLAKQQYRQS